MRRLKRWLDTWLMVVLCCVFLAMSVVVIPLGIAASRDEGAFGTFTAVDEDGGRRGCHWTGEFARPDGSIHRDDAIFDSEDLQRPGDEVRVQRLSSGESRDAPHDRRWVLFVIADAVCGAYVGLFVWRRRRRAEDETAA